MRGVRSFLLLLVVALGLGGYLYFVESKREPGDSEKKDKVFTVESDKIDEITVKAESGEQTTLKKTGTDWQIVQPTSAQSDSAVVSGFATNLSTLEVQRIIEENPQDLAEYGLAQPRVEVTFKAGGQEQRLLIGRKTPPGTDLYAKLGNQQRVFLISSYLDSTFNKTTFDLRDKTAIKLDRDKIETLAITTPKQIVQFAKAGNEWQMTAPVKARADFTAVDGLVSRINTLQMKSITAADVGQAWRVWPGQAGGDRSARIRLVAGIAPHRRWRRQRCGVREGPVAANHLHDRLVAPERPAQGSR